MENKKQKSQLIWHTLSSHLYLILIRVLVISFYEVIGLPLSDLYNIIS